VHIEQIGEVLENGVQTVDKEAVLERVGEVLKVHRLELLGAHRVALALQHVRVERVLRVLVDRVDELALEALEHVKAALHAPIRDEHALVRERVELAHDVAHGALDAALQRLPRALHVRLKRREARELLVGTQRRVAGDAQLDGARKVALVDRVAQRALVGENLLDLVEVGSNAAVQLALAVLGTNHETVCRERLLGLREQATTVLAHYGRLLQVEADFMDLGHAVNKQ
jgi:hypothetical protein